MASLRKTLLTLGCLLGASQMCTIQTSVYFAFLVRFKSRHSNASVSDCRQFGAFLTFKTLYYLVIGAYSQSWLISAYLKLKGHSSLGYLMVDPFIAIVSAKYPIANVFFLTGLALFGLSFLNVDYGLSHGLPTYLTNLIYQVICQNPKDFFKLNGHLPKVPSPKYLLLHPVKSLAKIRFVASQLWNPSQGLTFASSRLEAFPYLSMRTRSRLVLLTFIYERALAGGALALVFILALFLVIAMSILSADLSFPLALAVFIDILLLAFIAWRTVIFIFISIHIVLLFTFLTRTHLKEMNHALATHLLQLKKYRITNGSPLLSRQLSAFFTEHCSLATIQIKFNEQMVSPFFFVAFFSALLFQVVQLNILLLVELHWAEKGVCLMISITETVVSLQTIVLLIIWTDSLYSSRQFLFQAQGMFHQAESRFLYSTSVRGKLKLMTYNEHLCTKKKVRFTVGPLGKISKQSLYEFFFVYSGFFLYITSLMRKDV